MRIEIQQSNGTWTNLEADRVEKFVETAAKFGADVLARVPAANCGARIEFAGTVDAVRAALADCQTLSYGPDWYEHLRDGEAVEAKAAAKHATRPTVETCLCDCGHTVPRRSVLSTSRGSSCPDCYDQMSL